MNNDFKRIPYGISNFKQVQEENLYLVDKTMFFERMERAGNFLFLVRPRRFGKSLFLNMLEAYYDINEKDNFQELFKGLYVAEHPTENRNKYLVMHLDFSKVQGNVDHIAESLNDYMSLQCDLFALKYKKYYPEELTQLLQESKTGSSKLNLLGDLGRMVGLKLYLIVDEYDNFTNDILNVRGQQAYQELTHGTGVYRELFKKFKPMFDRIIMLGVAPITLDDLTSGYNIALNMTIDQRFNQMLGFSEDEVRQMIRYYKEVGAIKPEVTEDSIIADIKPWYDNYCFAEESFGTEPSMFNSDMVCYYMSTLVNTGRKPKEMVDPNTKTDYKKPQPHRDWQHDRGAPADYLRHRTYGIHHLYHQQLLPRREHHRRGQLHQSALLLRHAHYPWYARCGSEARHPEQQRAHTVLQLPHAGLPANTPYRALSTQRAFLPGRRRRLVAPHDGLHPQGLPRHYRRQTAYRGRA